MEGRREGCNTWKNQEGKGAVLQASATLDQPCYAHAANNFKDLISRHNVDFNLYAYLICILLCLCALCDVCNYSPLIFQQQKRESLQFA